MTRVFVALAAAAVCAAPVSAQELAGLRIGESLVGTKPEKDDLKGKVVLVERWGVH